MISRQVKFFSLFLLVIYSAALFGAKKQTFSMSNSLLLFGTYGQIRIVSDDGETVLHPPIDTTANRGYFAFPSISPDGNLIAWGFAITVEKERTRHPARFSMGVFSRSTRKWRTFGDFDEVGYAAFSPDGSKVAFVSMMHGERQLTVLNVRNGDTSNVKSPLGMPTSGGLSWAPDGKQFAVVIERGEKPSQIAVFDLASGKLKPVGEGYEPAWSPTGKWIAYYAGQKCILVHPDGTGATTVLHVSGGWGYKSFNGGLVWSPDGTKLLLNQVKGDGPNLDVLLFDLEARRTVAKYKDKLPVFGWIYPKTLENPSAAARVQ